MSPIPTIHVLLEDDGLVEFFKITLPITPLTVPAIQVLPGHGWGKLFAEYERLLEAGCDPRHIVPVLDADTITEKLPSGRRVLKNPNLFRLEKDLESAYEPWMFAEMLITLKCSPFGNEPTPEHQRTCEWLVNAAKHEAFQSAHAAL